MDDRFGRSYPPLPSCPDTLQVARTNQHSLSHEMLSGPLPSSRATCDASPGEYLIERTSFLISMRLIFTTNNVYCILEQTAKLEHPYKSCWARRSRAELAWQNVNKQAMGIGRPGQNLQPRRQRETYAYKNRTRRHRRRMCRTGA